MTKRILCFGDSITESSNVSIPERWPHLLNQSLSQKFLLTEVLNLGRGGATTASAFAEFELCVLPSLPSIVLLQFGFNDSNVRPWTNLSRVSLSEFERNYIEFISCIRRHSGIPVIIRNHTPQRHDTNYGNDLSYNQNYNAYDCSLINMAYRHQVDLIDLPSIISELGHSERELVNSDGLHLSAAGNRIYASAVSVGLIRLNLLLPRVSS